MWYQFWPPFSPRAVRAVVAMWRWWLIIFVVVAIFSTSPTGRSYADDQGNTTLPFTDTTFAASFPCHVRLWVLLAVLLITCVFLCMGFSRGLPHHLRVFGKFEDPNPWVYDSDASTFAEDLVTTPGEVDNDTGVEIVRVTGNIIEPGEPGMLFFRRPIRCTWDNLWNALLDRACKRGVIVGNARTGKSYSLMYVLRKALADGRVVVLELRKDAKAVYLFEPSGRGSSFRCRAWHVRKSRWQDDGCAVLENPNNVFLVDVDQHDDQAPLRPRGMAFMASSLHPDHYKEWIKGPRGNGKKAFVGTANLAEIQFMCTSLRVLTAEQAERRYNIAGGRVGVILGNSRDADADPVGDMDNAVGDVPLHLVRRIAGLGQLTGASDDTLEAHSMLLTLRYLDRLYAEVMDVHSVAMHGAGRLFERYMRCLVGMGGTFRVRRLDSPEEERLTLPPATIRASPAGAGSTQAFRDNWAALTSIAEPHTAVEESPRVGLSIDNALVGSPASVRVLRPEDLPRLLPHYAEDYSGDAGAVGHDFDGDNSDDEDDDKDDAGGDGGDDEDEDDDEDDDKDDDKDDAGGDGGDDEDEDDDKDDDKDDAGGDGGDDDRGTDGANNGRVLLMPLSSVDNVPCVDAADAINRAYQVTVSRLHQKKLSYQQLRLHLDAIGATAADRLQLYYFVPAAYFDEVSEAGLKRVTLKGATGGQATALRRRYDEYLMAVDCENKGPFVDAARRMWNQAQ